MYGWKDGSRIKINAESVGTRLQELHAQYGFLTAEVVLADASSPASPLHSHFEWDDTEAAQAYRLAQARHLLNCIVVLRGDENKAPIRAYVIIGEKEGTAYQDLNIVMSDALLREQVLARALREASQWQQRYNDLVELAAVFDAIEATSQQVKRRGRRSRSLAGVA